MDFGKIIEPRRLQIEAPRRKEGLSNAQRKAMLNIILPATVIWNGALLFISDLGAVHALSVCGIVLAVCLIARNNDWR